MIKIIPGEAPENDLPCIEVHTYPNAKGVTISHITMTEEADKGVRFGTIVDRKEMSLEDATEIATMFARKAGHSKIYVRDDRAK